MDPIDIFRTCHTNGEKHTFFSSAHGTFSRIHHILGHKSNLSKLKKKKKDCIKHLLQPQCYENRYQLQVEKKKKNCKKHKHIEIKQHKCSGLVHWEDPERWDGEGGRRGDQDREHM